MRFAWPRVFRIVSVLFRKAWRGWKRRIRRGPPPELAPTKVEAEEDHDETPAPAGAVVISHPQELTPEALISVWEAFGYKLFRGPWNLNVFGIRTGLKAGAWDDWIGALYQDDDLAWCIDLYQGTTDPSDIWLARGNDQEKGTAIVAEGQHLKCWRRGLHRQKYEALVSRGAPNPMTVIRDANRDEILDVDVENPTLDTGWHGTNLHRGSAHRRLDEIGLYSAGCIVVADPTDYAALIDLINKSAETYGEVFSFTLLRWPLPSQISFRFESGA